MFLVISQRPLGQKPEEEVRTEGEQRDGGLREGRPVVRVQEREADREDNGRRQPEPNNRVSRDPCCVFGQESRIFIFNSPVNSNKGAKEC